jgi:hypothetical protein
VKGRPPIECVVVLIFALCIASIWHGQKLLFKPASTPHDVDLAFQVPEHDAKRGGGLKVMMYHNQLLHVKNKQLLDRLNALLRR